MVISVVPPGGIVQARHLCERFRRRSPDLPIVISYLGQIRDYDRLLTRMSESGATLVATSAAQTRAQVLELLSRRARSLPVHPDELIGSGSPKVRGGDDS